MIICLSLNGQESVKYTKLLEGDNINSISIIIPSLIELEKHLENLSKSFPDKQIIIKMKDDLKTRFKTFTDTKAILFDPIFVSATSFDPKFALFLNPEQIKSASQFIESLIFRIQNSNEQHSNEQDATEQHTTELQSTEQQPDEPLLLNMLMNIINTKELRIQKPLNVKNEIDSYIDHLTKHFLRDFNLPKSYFANLSKENDSKLTVFKFWPNDIIINKFPTISQVACDILSVPATQASCESF